MIPKKLITLYLEQNELCNHAEVLYAGRLRLNYNNSLVHVDVDNGL